MSVISLDMALKFNPTCTSSGFNIDSPLAFFFGTLFNLPSIAIISVYGENKDMKIL